MFFSSIAFELSDVTNIKRTFLPSNIRLTDVQEVRTMTTNSVFCNRYHKLIEADTKQEVTHEDVEANEEAMNGIISPFVFFELILVFAFPSKSTVDFGQDYLKRGSYQ